MGSCEQVRAKEMASSDMTRDVFAEQDFGKIALKKIGDVPENFRLYYAGWLGTDRQMMKVVGAEFRKAKRGINKGKLSIMIPGTDKKTFVAAEELNSFSN